MNDTPTGQLNMDFLSTSAAEFLKDGPKTPIQEVLDRATQRMTARKAGEWLYAEGSLESKEKGTTARANAGKPKWHLLPINLLKGVVNVLEYGARKYAPWNWAKGGKWSTPIDSAFRHIFAFYWLGEDIDPESGEHHLDHAICNLLFARHYTSAYPEGDDRPKGLFT